MTLNSLFQVLGSGVWVRIGAEKGNGWLEHDRVIHLYDSSQFLEREVVSIYDVEGRKGSRFCSELNAGIAIEVEGDENGRY